MISDLYLRSGSVAKPLRIGAMLEDFQLSAVFRQVLTDIGRSDFAHVELVIVDNAAVNRDNPFGRAARSNGRFSFWRALGDRERRRSLLYDFFHQYDRRRLFKPDPLETTDCTDLLAAVHRLNASSDLAAIRACDLDVILRFGCRAPGAGIAASARHGVWFFRYGARDERRAGPPLFWEVVDDNLCSEATLYADTGTPDNCLILCQSVFPTARGYWPSRNIFQPCWGSSHFVIRKLHELHEQGWEAATQHAVSAPCPDEIGIRSVPANARMLGHMVLNSGEELVRRLNPWYHRKLDQWRICIRGASSPGLIQGRTEDKSGFRWMPCPPGHYYADPVLIEHRGQVWIFFEDYLYGEKRGRIGCAPVHPDGSLGETVVCLDLACHHSYPIVFHHEGEVFMMPESVANGSVELWRAAEFPFSWKLERTLARGLFVDTTPVLYEGRWYFFTALLSRLNTHAAFGALFSSDTLTGDWVRHPECPISTDVRDARPAGAIVKTDNRLLRPLQDCSGNYGRRIHVEEILELSPTAYKARRIHSIEPDWEKGLTGVHTYAWCAGFEVLDAVRRLDHRVV